MSGTEEAGRETESHGDTSVRPWKVAGGLEEGCHKGGSPSKAGPVGLPGAEGVLNPSSTNVFNSIIHSSKKKKKDS